MNTIWTIGHSTLSFEDFVKILHAHTINVLIDIRRFPGSRKFPHFNREALQERLPETGIRYQHMEGLGGRRSAAKNSKNTAWRNSSFRGYADYMETSEFTKNIIDLEQIAIAQRVAYMCSEAVWWSCHRSLVSDFLKARGWKVLHIVNATKADEHPWTSPARIKDGKLTYVDEGMLDL